MPFSIKPIQNGHGLLFSVTVGCSCTFWVKPVQMDMGCSSAWVSEAVLVKNISKRTWVALQCGLLILFWVQPVQILNGLLFSVGCSYYLGSKPYQKDMGCSSVWVTHAHLDQTSTNWHGLLFSVGYSCLFGSNQYKWTWVALQCGLLMPIWVKPEQIAWVALQFGLLMPFWVKIISKGHGLLFSVGCSCPFGSNQHKRTWVALQCGLLMPIWVKPAQMDMGCSSVWVTHAYFGQTSTNGHGLLFSAGCSCLFGSNQYEWICHGLLCSLGYSCHFGSKSYQSSWVALQCGLLIPFWVKTIPKRHGLLFSVGCSSFFGTNYYQKDVGCSSVQVTHVKIHIYVRI